jgi:hypothetical protein
VIGGVECLSFLDGYFLIWDRHKMQEQGLQHDGLEWLAMAPTYQLHRWRTQRWQKGSRYYICRVEQDLFGTWLMSSEWGGLRVGRRRLREETFLTYEAALARFNEVNQRRQRRGYTVVIR